MSDWLNAEYVRAPESLTVIGYVEERYPTGELYDAYLTAVELTEVDGEEQWVFDRIIARNFTKKYESDEKLINTTPNNGIKRTLLAWTLMPFHPDYFNYKNPKELNHE